MALSPTDIAYAERFHGHMCPGLTLGMRAGEFAVAEFGVNSFENELIAIVETAMCGVDGIQAVTGCTFGKGNLVHRDHGKNVFTFVSVTRQRAIRLAVRADAFGPEIRELEELSDPIKSGAATDEQRSRFADLRRLRSLSIFDRSVDEVFDVSEVLADDPRAERGQEMVACVMCGEMTQTSRVVQVPAGQSCRSCT